MWKRKNIFRIGGLREIGYFVQWLSKKDTKNTKA